MNEKKSLGLIYSSRLVAVNEQVDWSDDGELGMVMMAWQLFFFLVFAVTYFMYLQ
jgi:hypothetical protein